MFVGTEKFAQLLQLGDAVRERDGGWTICNHIQETSATVCKLETAAIMYTKASGVRSGSERSKPSVRAFMRMDFIHLCMLISMTDL